MGESFDIIRRYAEQLTVKFLGVSSIALMWLGFLVLLKKWPGNKSMTLSQHAAQTKASMIYYFLLFLFALPMFLLFIFKWFIPEFNMPFVFGVVVSLCVASQALAVIFPEIGRFVAFHRYSAFSMALLMLPIVALIGLNASFSPVVRAVASVALVYQLIVVALLLPNRGYHKNVLLLQTTYVAAAHIVILGAAYFG